MNYNWVGLVLPNTKVNTQKMKEVAILQSIFISILVELNHSAYVQYIGL